MIGEAIRNARKARGWTQQRLSAEAGVSRRHLIALEQGANVSLDVLRKVAAALDLREIELGEVTLVARPERAQEFSGELHENPADEPWVAHPPIRKAGGRSTYPVAASISRMRPPIEEQESAEIPSSVVEIDEILVRVRDGSFHDSGLEPGELLVVQLRPSGEAATGEMVIVTVENEVDAGRWWEKHGRRELRYRSGRRRDLTHRRGVVIRGVVTYSFSEPA